MTELLFPIRGEICSLHTECQHRFLSQTDERPTGGLEPFDWLNLVRSETPDNSIPAKVRFSWKNNAAASVLCLSENEDLSDPQIFATTENEFSVGNLKVGTTYYWSVNDSPVAFFVTEDEAPRFITVDGITNVRDSGGYATASGKKIKQGLLFRGSEMDTHCTITEKGIRTMREELGIRTDLDLRGEKEGLISESPLGADIRFEFHPCCAYGDFLSYPETAKAIFDLLGDETAYPIFYHCWGGADRTGTIAFLLSALLGVSDETLALDYELTSLALWGSRNSQGELYQNFLARLDADFPAATRAEQAQSFLLACGVTNETLDKIRKIYLG